MAFTVPIEPLTRPFFVSIFLRSITQAPIANVSLASNPAVKLQSLLALFNALAALLLHLQALLVSSISSTHGKVSNLVSSAFNINYWC